MRSLSLIVLAFASLPSVAIAQREYPPQIEGAVVETYKSIDGVDLKTWLFQLEGHQASDRRAAIVFFFGGGWKSGSPRQFENHCRYLASQGMVAMTFDYRVRTRHETLADRCVADTKSAIRWVRQNAERLGVDPNRVAAGGGSAGGHLAACAATVDSLDEPSESGTISSVPNALVLFNPAVLLAPYKGTTLPQEKLDDIATRTGVPPEQISPIHLVRTGLPPTIIFHGEADAIVPFATVKHYTDEAAAKGNRVELIGYRDAGHGFFNVGRAGVLGEYYPDTIRRAHQFLRSLGYIDKPTEVASPKISNVHVRSDYSRCFQAFEEDQSATVAFIGGSITEMNGYRVMVEDMLRKRFPQTEFDFVNAGISSTCSTTGAFRLDRDVLSKHPDLLFVEFAVNDDQDAVHAERECIRGMEGILRHARTNDPDVDIVVTHFVNPPMLEKLHSGVTPVSSGAHEQVAAHYGVSTVDLAREVAERIDAGSLTWKTYGGTHPKPPGNQIAADMVEDLLTTAWSRSADPHLAQVIAQLPQPKRLGKPLDTASYFRANLVNPSTATTDAAWKYATPEWEKMAGAMRPRFQNQPLLASSEIGAELNLSFEGNAVGMFVLAGPDAGKVEYSIDGGETNTADLYHRFSEKLHYPRSVMLGAGLESGTHQLTLRISKDSHHKSEGHAIRILNFEVNR
ncbi:MAG: alpha/beta hydrolase fold domain-containing protein [Rubripirellula sp.]